MKVEMNRQWKGKGRNSDKAYPQVKGDRAVFINADEAEVLRKFADMREPSVAGLLDKYKYGYEAQVVRDAVEVLTMLGLGREDGL